MSEYEYEFESSEGTFRTDDIRLMAGVLIDNDLLKPMTKDEWDAFEERFND